MKNTVLVDSGPLIALFDGRDRYHETVLRFLKNYRGALLTTWPVLTEVSHMLDFNLDAQLDFLTWVDRGGVIVYDIPHTGLSSLIEMMRKYTDIPMDLADATLMFAAEETGIGEIVSIDSDFDIYRTLKRGMLKNILRN